MSFHLILASGSEIRARILANAGLQVQIVRPRVDENALREGMLLEKASPRDIADALAEVKALKISLKYPDAYVLGCDQILDYQKKILTKPENIEQAREQIALLSENTHRLSSAAVLYHQGSPIWRHVGKASLTMRRLSDTYIDKYVERNWPDISTSVGGYKIESEGIRLFSRIEGDYFTILGLPLLELLSYLMMKGVIDT